jgi:GPH family glycoside/pentoside/hexuronide:cation symporter
MSAPEKKIDRRNYAWGVGGVADNLLTFGLAWTIVPVFNIGYGVNAFWLGICIFIPRIIDVIADPIMGVISDRTRSRFGRRRPYILVGSIMMALLFALLWMPPWGSLHHAGGAAFEHRGTSFFGFPAFPVGQELALLLWVGVIYTLLTLAYTVFTVPYIALGYEFTTNSDVITKVMASRLYFAGIASLGVTWIYRLAVQDRFGGDETVGMRYIGVAVALAVAITGMIPALVCTESKRIERPAQRTPLSELFKATLGNRAFICVMGSMLIFVIALYTAGVMGAHISIFYVAQGNKQFGTMLGAVSGNIMVACNLLGMYPMMRLSTKSSKRRVALLCFSLMLIGNLSYWWTWNPRFPYLQYLSAAVIGFGNAGIWLMLDSMIGDVTKDDEARNGVQREGLYGASKCFMFKIAVAITSITGALVLNASGFQEQVAPSEQVQFNLRLLFIGLQCGGTALAAAAIYFFPISRKRAEENERIIDERKSHMQANGAIEEASSVLEIQH